MCCFRRTLLLTFITITAISESSCWEKSSNSDLTRGGVSGGGSLDGSSEPLSSIRTRRKSLLSEAELKEQLELAKVNGLKRRFKRFACWHSCAGSFYRKIVKPSDMLFGEELEEEIGDEEGGEENNSLNPPEQVEVGGNESGENGGTSGGDPVDTEFETEPFDENNSLNPPPPEQVEVGGDESGENGGTSGDPVDTNEFETEPFDDPPPNLEDGEEEEELSSESRRVKKNDKNGKSTQRMSDDVRKALESKKRSISGSGDSPKNIDEHVGIKKRAGLYLNDGDLKGLEKQRKLASASHRRYRD